VAYRYNFTSIIYDLKKCKAIYFPRNLDHIIINYNYNLCHVVNYPKLVINRIFKLKVPLKIRYLEVERWHHQWISLLVSLNSLMDLKISSLYYGSSAKKFLLMAQLTRLEIMNIYPNPDNLQLPPKLKMLRLGNNQYHYERYPIGLNPVTINVPSSIEILILNADYHVLTLPPRLRKIKISNILEEKFLPNILEVRLS